MNVTESTGRNEHRYPDSDSVCYHEITPGHSSRPGGRNCDNNHNNRYDYEGSWTHAGNQDRLGQDPPSRYQRVESGSQNSFGSSPTSSVRRSHADNRLSTPCASKNNFLVAGDDRGHRAARLNNCGYPGGEGTNLETCVSNEVHKHQNSSIILSPKTDDLDPDPSTVSVKDKSLENQSPSLDKKVKEVKTATLGQFNTLDETTVDLERSSDNPKTDGGLSLSEVSCEASSQDRNHSALGNSGCLVPGCFPSMGNLAGSETADQQPVQAKQFPIFSPGNLKFLDRGNHRKFRHKRKYLCKNKNSLHLIGRSKDLKETGGNDICRLKDQLILKVEKSGLYAVSLPNRSNIDSRIFLKDADGRCRPKYLWA